MSRTTRSEDNKQRLENLPEAFAPTLVEIERMLAALRTIEGNFKEDLLRSLANAASVVELQLQETVAAAEEAARKQTHAELRTRYANELELALTEKSLTERQLHNAGVKFEEQKKVWASKLEEGQRKVARIQTELEQSQAARLELEASLRRTSDKISETERSLTSVESEARQLASEKRSLEEKLQQAEAKHLETELAFNRLQADSQLAVTQKQGYQTRLQEIAVKLSTMEQGLSVLQNQNRQLTAEKIEIQTRLEQAEAKLIQSSEAADAAKLQAELKAAQHEK